MTRLDGAGGRDLETTFKAALKSLLSEHELEWKRKIDEAMGLLAGCASDVAAYLQAAEGFQRLQDWSSALEWLRKGLAAQPHEPALHYSLFRTLRSGGFDQEALAAIKEARQLWPGNASLLLCDRLYLPKIQSCQDDVDRYAARYAVSVAGLGRDFDLETKQSLDRVYEAVGAATTFQVGYQGYNCLSALEQYGAFLHDVMSRRFPQWSGRVSGQRKREARPLRVGFLSTHLRDHTVGRLFYGWIRDRNPAAYECYCYLLEAAPDAMTEMFRRSSDHFRQLPPDVEAACRQVFDDDLDILVYLDIGMSRKTSVLAALRLAPVQCVTWGHSVTSGLPTIDYYLSSQLMEPPNAQRHYSERLIALPNLGISYSRPIIPRPLLFKTRQDFGLRDDATVYLCCQNQYKYLPKYDNVIAEIASRVPKAQFLFVSPNRPLGDKFLARLDVAFRSRGLRAPDFCRILLPQIRLDFWNLYKVSDIFLDPLDWVGSITTLDAVAFNLPIVTRPGEFMRGRHSYAILTLLDAKETIAKDVEDYIQIAVRLAVDPDFRQHVRAVMRAGEPRLWEDRTCIDALESFFANAALPFAGT